jgi:transposase InsO family protein
VNCYPFIEAEKASDRNVKRACELLQVSRSAYYAHRTEQPSDRAAQDAELTEAIKQVHQESKGRYGAPRIHAELRRRGRRHGRKRVARLMRTEGVRGRTPKRWRKTTIPDPAAAARADLIRRDFSTDAAKINGRWCGDITYINTWEGWLYLATVIDIASRRVVGYAVADHLRTDLIVDALSNAVAARNPDAGLVFHSDRGCQGGFQWSSQHLDHGGVGWDDHEVGVRSGRDGRRCGRRAGRVSTSEGCSGSSGSGSPTACRARRRPMRAGCRSR